MSLNQFSSLARASRISKVRPTIMYLLLCSAASIADVAIDGLPDRTNAVALLVQSCVRLSSSSVRNVLWLNGAS